MKLVFYFGVMITMFSCLFGCSVSGYQSTVDYEKIADKITANTAKKLQEQKKLCLIGTGGGMMHDIQRMNMSFQFFQEVDLKEARDLVVYATKEYLEDINSNEKVRPYLHNYPFTAKNITIRIFICKPGGYDVSPGEITIAAANKGNLSYYIDYPEKHTIKKIYKETYEEALKLVSAQ